MEREKELEILIYSIQNKISSKARELLSYQEFQNIFEICGKIKELTIALENYIIEYNALK